jgi:hypothetical protein
MKDNNDPARDVDRAENVISGKIPPDLPPAYQEAKHKGSRRGPFFRSFLLWCIGLLGIFALGIAATWILQVRPRLETSIQLEREREELATQAADLHAALETLAPLEAENKALQARLDETQAHLLLSLVISDVASARIALSQDDVAGASTSLAGTARKLQEMTRFPDVIDPETLEGLQARLGLLLGEIEIDEFAARSDLEVLANNLALLEKSLYGD